MTTEKNETKQESKTPEKKEKAPQKELFIDFSRRNISADTVRSLNLSGLDTEEEDIPLFI